MKCPVCNKRSISAMRVFFASRYSTMECGDCGVQLKVSDKAIDVSNMLFQFVFMPLWMVIIFLLFIDYGMMLSVALGFIFITIFYLLSISFCFIFPLEVDCTRNNEGA